MSQNVVRPGFNSAPEYMVSGIPYVLSGSANATPQGINFDFVSRAITVSNNSPAGTFLLVGFTLNGVNGTNCFPLDGGKSARFEIRVRDIYFKSAQATTASFGMLAELTSIERRMMLPLTGSSSSQAELTGSIIWNGVG